MRAFVLANPRNDPLALACSAEQMWPEGYPAELGGAGLKQADVKVLVINGAEDKPYVDTADAFVAGLADARHVRVPGLDHLGAVESAVYRGEVVEFLQDVG